MLRTILLGLTLLSTPVIAEECGGFFNAYNGCPRSNFYVGGTYTNVIAELPQNVFVDFPAAMDRNPVLFDGGQPNFLKTTRDRDRWSAYAGYQGHVCGGWFFGLEVGYKNLGRHNITYNNSIEIGEETLPMYRRAVSWAGDALITCRYLFCTGFNVFLKGGAALVNMKLHEGNLFAIGNPGVINLYPEAFGPKSYNYWNIRPEVVLGAAYMLTNNLNIVASYGHIFAPNYYPQNTADRTIPQVSRPDQCPGYDFVSIGLELQIGCP